MKQTIKTMVALAAIIFAGLANAEQFFSGCGLHSTTETEVGESCCANSGGYSHRNGANAHCRNGVFPNAISYGDCPQHKPYFYNGDCQPENSCIERLGESYWASGDLDEHGLYPANKCASGCSSNANVGFTIPEQNTYLFEYVYDGQSCSGTGEGGSGGGDGAGSGGDGDTGSGSGGDGGDSGGGDSGGAGGGDGGEGGSGSGGGGDTGDTGDTGSGGGDTGDTGSGGDGGSGSEGGSGSGGGDDGDTSGTDQNQSEGGGSSGGGGTGTQDNDLGDTGNPGEEDGSDNTGGGTGGLPGTTDDGTGGSGGGSGGGSTGSTSGSGSWGEEWTPPDEKPDEEGDQWSSNTGPSLDTKNGWYTSKYPGGLSVIWATKKSALDQTAFMTGVVETFSVGSQNGACPDLSMPLPELMGGGTGQIPFGCDVLEFVGLVMIIGAMFMARKIIFGG